MQEQWTFDRVPDALAIYFAESQRPIQVQWQCDRPSRAAVVGVEGMPEWRSYWHPLRRVHQLDIDPARQVRITYRLTVH